MNARDILNNVNPDDYRGLDLQNGDDLPPEVEECAKSVKEDDPEMDKSTAIAICRDQLDMSEDGGCPSGEVDVNGQCVTIEEVDTVPSLLSSPTEFTLSEVSTEPIERVQEGDNQVRYKRVKLLQSGVWTDANSRETIWYSPEGISNLQVAEDNALNVMHDDDNEVATAGHIDPDTVEATDNALYADLVIDTSKAVGEFADQNLQQTLESGGAKGFGGPSVEISADGQKVEYNDRKGMHEMKAGTISGAGLVGNPASKPVAFSRQTAERGVALSEGDGGATVMQLQDSDTGMTVMELRETLEDHDISLEGKDDDEIRALADALGLADDEEEDEDEEEDGEGDEGEDMEDDEEETPDGEDTEEDEEDEDEEDEEMPEMSERVEAIEERLQNVEDMMEQAMAAEDVQETLSEELEDAKGELADAEMVQELSEAKEELDRRLSELEEQPEDPRSLSGSGENGDEDAIGGPISAVESRDRPY